MDSHILLISSSAHLADNEHGVRSISSIEKLPDDCSLRSWTSNHQRTANYTGPVRDTSGVEASPLELVAL